MEKKLTKEEQKKAIMAAIKRHREKVSTDPEYKKEWKKQKADFAKIALLNDDMEN